MGVVASASGEETSYRVLLQGKKAAGLPKQGTNDFLPLRSSPRADTHCRNYALQQSLIPRKIDVEELFDDTTRALEA